MKLNLKPEAGMPKPIRRHGLSAERGVALVLTLILLSVITFMAITFLAVSHREKDSVTTVTDTATARLAADAALAHAEAQAVANILATTNPFAFGLMVSTNYLLTNSPTGNPADQNNFANLTNLIYFARAPVFTTNAGGASFYLDLNRNGMFDTNGIVADVVNGVTNGIFSFQVGDPEWIGVLERPDQPHGPNNPFIARYAFIAVPADGALDLNFIHNQARRSVKNSLGDDGYFRNQGVGSWEINLAAFLADLNTNEWFSPSYYDYEPMYVSGPLAQYRAFDDALALLDYRYNPDYTRLVSGNNYFPNNTANRPWHIDLFSDGPLQVTLNTNAYVDDYAQPWPGSENTNGNRYFSIASDVFDQVPTFAAHLMDASTNILYGPTNTYNRYTYYRLLSQLGTDSSPAGAGKINVNYRNVTNGVVVAGMETNFYAWTPLEFFTNAADRMLRAYSQRWVDRDAANYGSNYIATFCVSNAFGIGNIPVLVSNRFVYTPAVQRVLQFAANMYDAVYYTNHYAPNFASSSNVYLPSVFQPLFGKQTNNGLIDVFITGFREVENSDFTTNTIRNLSFGSTPIESLRSNDLVFGVPLIIGAKKGLPNFNEFSMESAFQLTRKLQLTRPNVNASIDGFRTNLMYALSITNQVGVECWNSYTSPFMRPFEIYVTNYMTIVLANDMGYSNSISFVSSGYTNGNTWAGQAFQIPLNEHIAVLPESIYRFNNGVNPYFTTNNSVPFETNIFLNGTCYPQPRWTLTLTNNLQVLIVDSSTAGVIDYVQLKGPNRVRDLSAEIMNNDSGYKSVWNTNLTTKLVPYGIVNQIDISRGQSTELLNEGNWVNIYGTKDFSQAYFAAFFNTNHIGQSPSGTKATNVELQVQAPYNSSRLSVDYITWQANDPLVHYMANDLSFLGGSSSTNREISGLSNLGVQNKNYQPWGVLYSQSGTDNNPTNLAYKDPLVRQSENWDFPTNRLPGVGWLGRVHRGTPWQTVYLKASNILNQPFKLGTSGFTTWTNWTGDLNGFDATNTAPIQDRLIFDLFTTGFNDNATRGTLSVNQSGLAAWSALFSGMVAITNTTPTASQYVTPTFNPFIIQPAGVDAANSALWRLVNGANGINVTRSNFVNIGGLKGSFNHVGDVLQTPALTEQSPFLNLTKAQVGYGISDEVYEWLPQQAMSLLDCPTAPRYVIYCYGQTLKPAQNGVNLSSTSFGLVTNYQVTAEFATRAVVRIEATATNILGTNVLLNPRAVVESFNVLPPD